MTIKRKIISTAAAFAVLSVVLLGVASPAQASYANCPGGTACVYTLGNGGGSQFVISFSNSGGLNNCKNFPSAFNDTIDSGINGFGTYNGHPIALIMWAGPNCTNDNIIGVIYANSSESWTGTSKANVFSSWGLTTL